MKDEEQKESLNTVTIHFIFLAANICGNAQPESIFLLLERILLKIQPNSGL